MLNSLRVFSQDEEMKKNRLDKSVNYTVKFLNKSHVQCTMYTVHRTVLPNWKCSFLHCFRENFLETRLQQLRTTPTTVWVNLWTHLTYPNILLQTPLHMVGSLYVHVTFSIACTSVSYKYSDNIGLPQMYYVYIPRVLLHISHISRYLYRIFLQIAQLQVSSSSGWQQTLKFNRMLEGVYIFYIFRILAVIAKKFTKTIVLL
jgi:hypothetical protein